MFYQAKNYNLQIINTLENELLELPEAKKFLRIDHDNDDKILAKMIKAVRLSAEHYTGISLLHRTMHIAYSQGITSRLELPFGPVHAIIKIELIDNFGKLKEFASNNYQLQTGSNILELKLPVISPKIFITYVTGFHKETIPQDIMQAMLIHLAKLYEARDAHTQMPIATIELLKPYRTIKI